MDGISPDCDKHGGVCVCVCVWVCTLADGLAYIIEIRLSCRLSYVAVVTTLFTRI